MRIPDPQLNYHADRYIAQRISAHGITFERYLSDPAYFDALALQPEPLLPAQRTVAERLDAESRVTIAYDLNIELTFIFFVNICKGRVRPIRTLTLQITTPRT